MTERFIGKPTTGLQVSPESDNAYVASPHKLLDKMLTAF
jgi:hypothetical protein